MAKTLRQIYEELSVPPNLKKPGVGQGSGQHTVGNMSVQSKSPEEAHRTLQSPSNIVKKPELKLDASKPAPKIATPIMDKAVKDQAARKPVSTMAGQGSSGRTAIQNNGRLIAQKRREGGRPVLPARSVPGLNKDPKAVASAQANSDAIMKNARVGGQPQTVTRGAKTVSNFKKGATPAPAPQTAQAATAPPRSASTIAKAPTPTAKPEQKQSFAQAFAAARKKAGGGSGVFTWNGKQYQTNVKGEKYQKLSKLKKV